MRVLCATAVLMMLASAAGYAQTTSDQNPNPPRSNERPIDNGPTTPDSNRAYQGGGVTLQGAPGAPAPTPQATPPGQTPSNTVPPK